MRREFGLVLAGGVGMAGVLLASAGATPPYRDEFQARYPSTTLLQRFETLTGSDCNACHIPPQWAEEGNCYRLAVRELVWNAGLSFQQAMAAVEWQDSDSDGVPNIVEILMPRGGGHVGYNPGLVGPTGTSPCGPDPQAPVSGQNETPAWCYANCDASLAMPVLNVQDFTCFLQRYAAGDGYANCDQSTEPPTLNVQDFTCFLQRYAAGCP